MKSDLVDLQAEKIHETDKAFLFEFGLSKPIWIPKSACEFDGKTVTMSASTAISKGLDNLL